MSVSGKPRCASAAAPSTSIAGHRCIARRRLTGTKRLDSSATTGDTTRAGSTPNRLRAEHEDRGGLVDVHLRAVPLVVRERERSVRLAGFAQELLGAGLGERG